MSGDVMSVHSSSKQALDVSVVSFEEPPQDEDDNEEDSYEHQQNLQHQQEEEEDEMYCYAYDTGEVEVHLDHVSTSGSSCTKLVQNHPNQQHPSHHHEDPLLEYYYDHNMNEVSNISNNDIPHNLDTSFGQQLNLSVDEDNGDTPLHQEVDIKETSLNENDVSGIQDELDEYDFGRMMMLHNDMHGQEFEGFDDNGDERAVTPDRIITIPTSRLKIDDLQTPERGYPYYYTGRNCGTPSSITSATMTLKSAHMQRHHTSSMYNRNGDNSGVLREEDMALWRDVLHGRNEIEGEKRFEDKTHDDDENGIVTIGEGVSNMMQYLSDTVVQLVNIGAAAVTGEDEEDDDEDYLDDEEDELLVALRERDEESIDDFSDEDSINSEYKPPPPPQEDVGSPSITPRLSNGLSRKIRSNELKNKNVFELMYIPDSAKSNKTPYDLEKLGINVRATVKPGVVTVSSLKNSPRSSAVCPPRDVWIQSYPRLVWQISNDGDINNTSNQNVLDESWDGSLLYELDLLDINSITTPTTDYSDSYPYTIILHTTDTNEASDETVVTFHVDDPCTRDAFVDMLKGQLATWVKALVSGDAPACSKFFVAQCDGKHVGDSNCMEAFVVNNMARQLLNVI